MGEPRTATQRADAMAADPTASAAIWDALGRRDSSAGELLADLIRRVCRPVFQRKGVPSADLPDLEQDVLATVWAAACTGRPAPRNLDGYLYWRARAVFRTYVREQGRRRALDTFEDAPARHTDPADRLAAQDLRAVLEQCSRELTKSLRQAWDARYQDGLENRAAAAALGISVNAYAVRIFRASQQIQARLRAQGWLADA